MFWGSVEAFSSPRPVGTRTGTLPNLVVTAAGRFGCCSVTAALAVGQERHVDEPDECDAPHELHGEDVVGDPVHQRVRDAPGLQHHDGANDEADEVAEALTRWAAVQLLGDLEDVGTEVQHALDDSVEEVGEPNQDEPDGADAGEAEGVVVVVEGDAEDHREDDQDGDLLVLPPERDDSDGQHRPPVHPGVNPADDGDAENERVNFVDVVKHGELRERVREG